MEELLISILKKNLENKANETVLGAISDVVSAIDDILRKVDNDRATDALTCANKAYYIAKGYTEFNSYDLSEKLGASNNVTRVIIKKLIKEEKIEKISSEGVTFLKLINIQEL